MSNHRHLEMVISKNNTDIAASIAGLNG